MEGALLDRRDDTEEGEKLRLAKYHLDNVGYFQFKEDLFRVERERTPALQQYQSLSHLEADIRNKAMEINPYEPERIETVLRARIPALRRIKALDDRFKSRAKKNPVILLALKTYYS